MPEEQAVVESIQPEESKESTGVDEAVDTSAEDALFTTPDTLSREEALDEINTIMNEESPGTSYETVAQKEFEVNQEKEKTQEAASEDTEETTKEESTDAEDVIEKAVEDGANLSEDQKEEVRKLFAEGHEIVKIDGVEYKVTPEEALSNFQLKAASNKRFEEGAKMRKQAEQLVELLRTNPVEALRHINGNDNVLEMANKIVYENLQKEMMTPEERQKIDLEQEVRQLQENKNQLDKESQEREHLAMVENLRGDYEIKITNALQTVAVPKTRWSVGRMATLINSAVNAGYKADLNVIAGLVKEDYIHDFKSFFESADGDMIEELLGPELGEKIRKHDLSKLDSQRKQAIPQKSVDTSKANKNTIRKTKRKINQREMDTYIEKVMSGEA